MTYDNNSRGISYSAGFFILIAFALAGLVFASMIIKGIWNDVDTAGPGAFKVFQILSQVMGYFIPALVTAAMITNRPLHLLGYKATPKWSQVGLVVVIFFVTLIFTGGLTYINHNIPIPANWKATFDKMEADYISQVDKIIRLRSTGDFLLALVIMGMLPAICEETLFRGGLQNFLTRATKRHWLSIIIVSLIFSAAHFSFYGFLYRLFLGIVLGLLFHYSGKLWLSILAHFLNNALVITILYINSTQGIPSKESMKTEVSGWWGLLVLPVLIILFNYYKRISVPDQRTTFS